MISLNKLKRLNLFWILCSLMIYSYLPTLLGIRPIFITIVFQGFGIAVSLIVIMLGISKGTILRTIPHKAFFCLWTLYFLRMIYSIFFDNTLSAQEYLYDDLNKYFTYNLQLGLAILSLSTYSRNDLSGFESIFFNILSVFLILSLLIKNDGQNDVRADANSYIPTLLYGQYGCALALLSVHRFFRLQNKKLYYLITLMIGLYVVSVAGSRSAFLSFILVLAVMFLSQSDRFKLAGLVKLFSIGLVVLLALNINLMIGLVAIISEGFAERLSTTFLSEDGVDVGIREILYTDAWSQFIQSPFIGNHFVLTSGLGRGWYPHNLFFEIMINAGILGGILLLIALISGISVSLKLFRSRDENSWLAIMFLQFLIFSMSSLPLLRHLLLAAFLTLILCVQSKNKT